MRIIPVGAHALLLDLTGDPPGSVERWRAELWRRREAGEYDWSEIVTGARTVLIDGCDDPGALVSDLATWTLPDAAEADTGSLVRIPITYDGPDLDWIADHLGVSTTGFIARHLATTFLVAFCGFAPGFAYMTGFGATVPRLDTPRSRVPAGSVGLADSYCGIYPGVSPGGWRLVGHTSVTLFDADRQTPALLAPGTRVRFIRTGS